MSSESTETADTTDADIFLPLVLDRKEEIAANIWLFEFKSPQGRLLPGYSPGSHVTVQTPCGARRQYSLCGSGAQSDRYTVAIKKEQQGRGASISMVDDVRVGDSISLSEPKNTFALDSAERYLFIAGGIGITPIMSMLRYLASRGNDQFNLVYCTRDKASTAFLDELGGDFYRANTVIHHDHGDPDKIYDLWPHFEAPGKELVYCCGPRPMMEEVQDMSGHWRSGAIRFEDFASDVEAVRQDDHGFRVRHADSGQSFEIPANATILETLRTAGCDLRSSCESGTCGTCKVELVEGVADHRDMVLQDHERHSKMMICVSRALSEELVLRW